MKTKFKQTDKIQSIDLSNFARKMMFDEEETYKRITKLRKFLHSECGFILHAISIEVKEEYYLLSGWDENVKALMIYKLEK